MAEDVEQAKEDIAYIKGFLKEDGRAPEAVGHFYLVLGVAFGVHALRHFLLQVGVTVPDVATVVMPWDAVALALIGFAVSSTLMWRRGREAADMVPPHALSAGARAALAAWSAVSFAVLAGFLSLWLADIDGFAVAALILFVLMYGVGWRVTYAVHRVRWHLMVARGFFVWAVGTGLLAETSYLSLLGAAALVLLFAVPGFLIVRDAWKTP